MERAKILEKSVFIWPGYVQPAGHCWTRMPFLRYFTFIVPIVPKGVWLKDAVALAYNASSGTVDADGPTTDSVPAALDWTRWCKENRSSSSSRFAW